MRTHGDLLPLDNRPAGRVPPGCPSTDYRVKHVHRFHFPSLSRPCDTNTGLQLPSNCSAREAEKPGLSLNDTQLGRLTTSQKAST